MSEAQAVGQVGDPADAAFTENRALLFAVAYRILGRVADAEDVVQDTWLRWTDADRDDVLDPKAYLVKVTTRLSIDRLRRLQARRESYVGPWLPEPLLTVGDVADDVERSDDVSMAMLVVLETLSPLERAVFVLREAFAYSHAEIAAILGRSEAAVRQLASRARDRVGERSHRYTVDQAARRRVTERFLAACTGGDMDDLVTVLAPHVTLVGDGGGQARAPRRSIEGADKVARFLAGVAQQPVPDAGIEITEVNGGPGIVVSSAGRPVTVIVLDVAGDERVERVYLVANPAKLAGVTP